jgi:hypothetical protein
VLISGCPSGDDPSVTKRRTGFWDRLPRVLYPIIDRRENEATVFTIATNRLQGSRAVGGRLTLTSQRLAFTPHRLEFRAQSWTSDLSEVRRARTEPKGTGVFDGTLRVRLAVETTQAIEFFVVKDPAAVSGEINAALSA